MTDSGAEDRFARCRLLLGEKAFERLSGALVVVVGLGAVGSHAAEALARAGVGRLRIVDFDRVRPSNINRQIIALDSTVGKLKTDVAAHRIRDINPSCAVEAMQLFVEPSTIPDILSGPPDVLVDAIDSVGPKIILLEGARRRGIRAVSAMGAALHKDAGAIRVGDISETRVCRLARFIRKRLARRGVESGIRCIYSVEHAPHPGQLENIVDSGESLCRGRSRTPLGSLPTITGIFGLMAAHEAIMMLIGEADGTSQ